jgi:hypothetical protein
MKIQYEKDGSPRLGTEGDLDEFLVALVYSAANFNSLRMAVGSGNQARVKVASADLESTYSLAKSRFKRILAEHPQYEGNAHS